MPASYFGKYSGEVKDNRDSQQLGRLQVSVPSLFPADELMVARAALPYGVFLVPEVGAKVWVEFEGGDSGLPIWTGIQMTPGDWASEAKADPPEKRAIRTATGHLLLLDDTSNAEMVEIRVGVHGHRITLDSSGIRLTDGVNGGSLAFSSQGVELKDSAGNSLTLGTAGASIQATMIDLKGSTVKLGTSAALPVARVGDQGVGNLGAPVVILPPGNPGVLA